MNDIISISKLTKRYGDFVAVDGISLSVQAGETFGILGPNGAGKTTTLEMIEGLKSITDGTVIVDGKDVRHDPRGVKHVIGVQLQASSFFDYLNLTELIETFGALYNRRPKAAELLADVGLQEKAKSMVKELSGGQKQRLSIAVALVNEPKVLFLDEPTTGLDPQARRNLWDLITTIKKRGVTIVLTTHYMEEAEVLCDRIAIMDHAKIVALDTPLNLLRQSGIDSTIEFHVDREVAEADFSALPNVMAVKVEQRTVMMQTADPEKTLPALFAAEAAKNLNIIHLQLRQATLEDVFLKMTGRALRE